MAPHHDKPCSQGFRVLSLSLFSPSGRAGRIVLASTARKRYLNQPDLARDKIFSAGFGGVIATALVESVLPGIALVVLTG